MGLFTFTKPVCKECRKDIVGGFGIGFGRTCDKCGAILCKKCASQMKKENGKELCRDCWIVLSLEELRGKK